ncbi:hypothetical protein [Agrobacterium rubi]|uniref:hypothetical protein n=1 Tax=Agrobacterium rubi TaxID=28099 RepID=UPI0015734E9E|nr:hypothetical protein [Agrobacterium rubi]NTE87203.1 hypothetical protein [Agrobacterium rubi]NTF03137.1 hypothetical protein [Agrobacterium rubi]
MDVTNNSKAPQGIHTLDGLVYVLPGETKSVRLNETLHGHAKALDFFKLKGEPEDDDLGKADNGDVRVTAAQMDELKTKFEEQTAEIGRLKSENVDLTTKNTEQAEKITELEALVAELKAAPVNDDDKGYAVKTKGGGYYVITLDGADVTKSLRKDDVAEFPTMSDADKAAFVELHKPV